MNEQSLALKLIGKTIKSVSIDNNRNREFTEYPGFYQHAKIEFTDGTCLELKNTGQEGDVRLDLR